MAHFAEIQNGVVSRVLVVPDNQEARGAEFLAQDLGLGGTWIQTSYSGSIRGRFAGVGFTYDAVSDVFIAPQPFPSWVLDSAGEWQPPMPMPSEGDWDWDEGVGAWVEIVPSQPE